MTKQKRVPGNLLRLGALALVGILLHASAPAALAQDTDNDGILDASDPCVSDALNACYGPVAVDGTTGNDIRINTGPAAGACGGAKTDCRGAVWGVDSNFNVGSEFTGTPAILGLDAVFGAGCAPSAETENILQCERWDPPALPELEYSFDLPDGTYMVNLLFANVFTGTAAPGSRVFDIVAEGVTVYPAFDQIVASGGTATAVVRAAEVTVSDGNGLQIGLVHGVENPAIKGIEVLLQPCLVDGDCDDGNVCTDDTCNAGVCGSAPNTDACDDGIGCTDSDVCGAGVCAGTSNCPIGEFCEFGSGTCQSSNAEAFFGITPTAGINGTTFSAGSFSITNDSGTQNIVSIALDLSTAILPDMVFDPVGAAGDVGGKCFTPDGGVAATTGMVPVGDPCVDPFFGPHDGGFDGLTVAFTDFNPGETFSFSSDVDPTSIQGGANTGAAGAVSGLELNGATIIIEFDDGAIFTAQTFQTPPASEGGSQNVVKAGGPAAPTIEVLGTTPPVTTSDPTQTVQVCGPVGETAKLLIVEAELLLTAAPGFDLDPFEGNEAVFVQEFTAVIGPSGCVDFNVTLTDSASADDGLNYIVATILDSDGSGRTGPTSDVLVVEFDPTAIDNDNDGFSPPSDCNDNDDTVFPGAPEVCNGIDENCDGTADDGNPGGGASCGVSDVGECALGAITCTAGTLICVGNIDPAIEICNGLDDDCDGVVDNGNPGGGAQCGTTDVGACEFGVEACVAGAISCVGNVEPAAETCNGLDDDCDGAADEDNPGGGGSCSTGLLGVCAPGTEQCQSGAIACVQDTSASAEVCDNLDNNCDGSVDEGTGGATCATGDLGVCGEGTEVCNSGNLICTANSGPSPESCNGLDDDCDGQTDENNPGGGTSCSTGLPGVCADGVTECQAGLLQCVADSGSTEICDGLDNDCDGTVDNGNPGGGASCTAAEPGICSAGTEQCIGGDIECVSDVTPGIELCGSGEDEDCDGTADEPEDCVLCLAENTIPLATMTKRNKIKLVANPLRDKFIAKGTFFQPSANFSQPDEGDVIIRVTDELGVFYEALLPAGIVAETKPGRKYQYKDATRPFENDGVRQVKMSLKSDLVTTKYKVKSQEIDLPAFTGTASTMTIKIGDTCYVDLVDSCTAGGSSVKCQ